MPRLSSLSSRSLTGIGIGGRAIPTSTPANTIVADYNPNTDVWVATSTTGNASTFYAWNGKTWDAKSYPQLYIRNADDFRYYNGYYYVFVRTNSSVFTRDLYRSSDLNSWTLVLATGLSSNWEIYYNPSNGNFVVVGGGGTTTAFTSTDGSTWSSVSLPANASGLRSIGQPAWVGNNIVATNYGSSTDPIYRSVNNGADWTSVATNWAAVSYAGRSYTQDMAYGNGVYVAFVGQGYNATSVSSDGITWPVPVTRSNVPTFGNLIYFSSTKNKFIMTSLTTNDLGVSDDGVDWTLVSTSSVVQRIIEVKGRIYGYSGANTTILDITDVIPQPTTITVTDWEIGFNGVNYIVQITCPDSTGEPYNTLAARSANSTMILLDDGDNGGNITVTCPNAPSVQSFFNRVIFSEVTGYTGVNRTGTSITLN